MTKISAKSLIIDTVSKKRPHDIGGKITHNIIPYMKKIPLWWGSILIQNPFHIKMLIIWFLLCSKTDILIIEIHKGGINMKELWFSFGALSDKLSEQYKWQGYELKNAEKWDELVNSTVMLHIHGILTDSRYDECLERILKKCKVDLVKIGE